MRFLARRLHPACDTRRRSTRATAILLFGLALGCGPALSPAAEQSLTAFATKSVGGTPDLALQRALGAVAAQREAAAAQGPDLYFDSNAGRFARWCRKQGGVIESESGLEVLPKAAGPLWPAAASKEDAQWLCRSASGDHSVLAVVLRGSPRYTSVPSWGGGLRPAYEFQYAFFDGTSWAELTARRQTSIDSTRNATLIAEAARKQTEQARQEWRRTETARLRADPKAGDQTSLGLIVEVKAPLVLIQLNPLQRDIRKLAQEWMRIDSLEASCGVKEPVPRAFALECGRYPGSLQ